MRERWHRRCTTFNPRRWTGPFGGGGADGRAPAAQGVVGASASAWRVRAAAVRRSARLRVGAGRWRARLGVRKAGSGARARSAVDQKRAAPPRPCPCRSWHDQAMPSSASALISQLRDPNEMLLASLCAKLQNLQLCRSNFLQIRRLVRPKVLKNSTGQKGDKQFERAKHFSFGQDFSQRCRYALYWCLGISPPSQNYLPAFF